MDRADLEKLQQVRGVPAVSLLAPTDRRRPGNPEDPIVVRGLLAEAKERLLARHEEREVAPLVGQLEAAVRSIDFDHPADAIAVFATRDDAQVLTLPFSVRARVVIDETFATRDLAAGWARSPRYRVLVLSEKPTRLFNAVADQLIEVRHGGFPVVIEGALGEPLPSGAYPPHASRSNEAHRQFFRHVDRALGKVSAADPTPVVVVGLERDLAYYDEVTGHGELIVGRVQGDHHETAPRELGAIVWPAMQDHLAGRDARAVDELVGAVGAGRAAVGIKPVWEAANQGRGHRLLVEDSYFGAQYRVVDDDLEPAGDVDAPGVIEDVVDEIVEIVLAKGGEVAFVGPGELHEHGPIALHLRY